MAILIFIFLIAVGIFIRLKIRLSRSLELDNNNLNLRQAQYDLLFREHARLKQETEALEQQYLQTVALYDITREISMYLDEDKLFECFKDQLVKYITVSDCQFIKSADSLKAFSDSLVIPFKLKADQAPAGYLLARGVKPQDRDKFDILVHQFMLGMKRAVLYARVNELAITDSLTGAFSRRQFLQRFNEEFSRSSSFKYAFAFLMVDIDYFKDYNDRYGHLVGDSIIREVSRTIKENIRQIDFVGRYGGEEFGIVLAETDKQEALFVAERIRKAVESKNIKAYDEDLSITVSIGISEFPVDANTPQKLIECSDKALYRSKNSGRNKVCGS